MTIFLFDLQVWLDLQSTWTKVSNGTSTPQREQLCQIILKSMHKCTSYGLGKPNLWPFYHLTFKCDLDLQPSWTNDSNGTSTPQGEQRCQIIFKSMHKYTNCGPDKLSLRPFFHLTFKCDLDLNLPEQMFQNGTDTPQGEQLCQITLKSINNYISYGPDKLSLWPIYHWPSCVTLTFNLPDQMIQLALLLLKMNNCAILFWNPCINIQVIARTSSSYDLFFSFWLSSVTLTFNLPEEMFQMALLILRKTTVPNYFEILTQMYKLRPYKSGWSHACTTCTHQTEVVTTMSCSLQVGLTKIGTPNNKCQNCPYNVSTRCR